MGYAENPVQGEYNNKYCKYDKNSWSQAKQRQSSETLAEPRKKENRSRGAACHWDYSSSTHSSSSSTLAGLFFAAIKHPSSQPYSQKKRKKKKTRTSSCGAFLGSCFLALHTLFERLVFLALFLVLLQDLYVCVQTKTINEL
jgi:hypothetical protein